MAQLVPFKPGQVFQHHRDRVPSRSTNWNGPTCIRRCALNTAVQILSGLPGFGAALLHSPLEPGPLTRAVATAVNASLAAGPGCVGTVDELVEVLKEHRLVQEGVSDVMKDVDARELIFELLSGIQEELVLSAATAQAHLEADLDVEATYIPVMTSSYKLLEAPCNICKHRFKGEELLVIPIFTLGVDPEKGCHQSMQSMFAADLQQHARCPRESCRADIIKQARFQQWPLALMLNFNEQEGLEVSIGLQDTVQLPMCPHLYRLVRILFQKGSHFTLGARRADGLWVYLDSESPVETMPLQLLLQQRGHWVVGALLITTQHFEDDGRMLLADFLRDTQQASGLAR
ncbi:hypothetical protein ABBQ38_014797 [Trebouxia sp. C0009 RCD-2024]